MKRIVAIALCLILMASCTNEIFLNEEVQLDEDHYPNPELRPFANWLKTPTATTRSLNPEIDGLIEKEKREFDTKFAYIKEYFRITPNPRWNSPKIVQYNTSDMDIFILCGNTNSEKVFKNDLVFIISKRNDTVLSWMKLLPKDENFHERLVVSPNGENVYLNVEQIEENGGIVSQTIGYITKDTAVSTRSTNCWNQIEHYNRFDGYTLERYGDGSMRTVPIYTPATRMHLICDHVNNELNESSPASGGGSIPAYTPPPPTSGGGGSSSGGSYGNNGGGSYGGGNSGNYGGGGYGGGSGYNPYTDVLGGGGSSGGSSGSSGNGGNTNYGNDWQHLPVGGIDFIADEGYGLSSTMAVPNNDLPKKKPKDILEDCNDIIRALKNALKGNSDTFINFTSPHDDKTKYPSYSDYLDKIKADPTREHSINLSYYPENNEYITNEIQTGSEYNVTISTSNRTIANVHNHPNNMPPSPCDMRTMISNVVDYAQYKALYTLTNDGTYYAFYVTDRAKAIAFWNTYKDKMVIGTDNHFDENTDFYDSWRNAIKKFDKLVDEDAWNYALAYLMDKYDMGIGLFRQKKGDAGFTSLHMKKDDQGIYMVVKCK